MNVELLRMVKEHILAEPARLNMGSWVIKGKPGETIEGTKGPKFAKCGTAACIGGWAKVLSHLGPWEGPSFGAILGLDVFQEQRLFYRSSWPEKFRKKYKDNGSAKSAKVAADRIEHFIATEGRE